MQEIRIHGTEQWFDKDETSLLWTNNSIWIPTEIRLTRKGNYISNFREYKHNFEGGGTLSLTERWKVITKQEAVNIVAQYQLAEAEEQRTKNELEV